MGQNEMDKQNMRSVSVGDIIFLDGVRVPGTTFVKMQGYWVIESVGFKKLSTVDEVWDHVAKEGNFMVTRYHNAYNELYDKHVRKVGA